MKKPAWSDSKLPKPGEPGFTSKPGEEKLAKDLGGRRRVMSGAGELPFDVHADVWLVDQKETSLQSHTVKRKDLDALADRALAEGRFPMYSIVFWQGQNRGEPWFLVPQSILIEFSRGTTHETDS